MCSTRRVTFLHLLFTCNSSNMDSRRLFENRRVPSNDFHGCQIDQCSRNTNWPRRCDRRRICVPWMRTIDVAMLRKYKRLEYDCIDGEGNLAVDSPSLRNNRNRHKFPMYRMYRDPYASIAHVVHQSHPICGPGLLQTRAWKVARPDRDL